MSDDIAARFHAAMSSPDVNAAATALRSALEDISGAQAAGQQTFHVESVNAMFDGCRARGRPAVEAGLNAPRKLRGDTVSNITLEQVVGAGTVRLEIRGAWRCCDIRGLCSPSSCDNG